MKKLLLFSLCFLFTISLSYAKVWRVNNQPNTSPDFNNLPAAVQNAANGDTIYLEPSPNGYSGIRLTKRLVIIGNGWFLLENQNNQVNTSGSTIEGALSGTGLLTGMVISFEAGSEGSVIQGLRINGGIQIQVSNISIIRNSCVGSIVAYVENNNNPLLNNILIQGNYISSFIHDWFRSVAFSSSVESRGRLNLARIVGNYVGANIDISDGASSSAIIENNIVHNYISVSSAISIVQNNIVYGGNVQSNGFIGSMYNVASPDVRNNFFAHKIAGVKGENNKEDVVMGTSMFAVAATATSLPAGFSPDSRWQLAENSPAKGAATDGGDCGMFGGSMPYVLSVMPAIPSIYKIETPTAGTPSGGLKVKISAKSNL